MPVVPSCGLPMDWATDWRPEVAPSDARIRASYDCGDVDLHIAVDVVRPVRPGMEAITRSSRVVTPRQSSQPLPNVVWVGAELGVRQFELDRLPDGTLSVWTWYAVDGHALPTFARAKAQELWTALTLKPVNSSVFVVAARRGTLEQRQRVLADAAEAAWETYVRSGLLE
jgi:hypothetical protein